DDDQRGPFRTQVLVDAQVTADTQQPLLDVLGDTQRVRHSPPPRPPPPCRWSKDTCAQKACQAAQAVLSKPRIPTVSLWLTVGIARHSNQQVPNQPVKERAGCHPVRSHL